MLATYTRPSGIMDISPICNLFKATKQSDEVHERGVWVRVLVGIFTDRRDDGVVLQTDTGAKIKTS